MLQSLQEPKLQMEQEKCMFPSLLHHSNEEEV